MNNIVLHDNDVLLGRGIAGHRGTQYYQSLVGDHVANIDLDSNRRARKWSSTSAGVIFLQFDALNPPGRFIQIDTNGLLSVHDERKSLQVIAKALRDRFQRRKADLPTQVAEERAAPVSPGSSVGDPHVAFRRHLGDLSERAAVANLLDAPSDTDEDSFLDVIINLVDLSSVSLPKDHFSTGDLDEFSIETWEVDEPVTRTNNRRSGRTRGDRARSLRHSMADALHRQVNENQDPMTNENARLRLQIKSMRRMKVAMDRYLEQARATA